MQIGDLLKKAQKVHLRTEMEVFLAYLLKVDRSELMAFPEREVPVPNLAELQKGWAELMAGKPVAYLIHEKEFYGLSLYVDERVLVPRPETEQLVDFVLERIKDNSQVLEIGTGSGAIALALKSTKPELNVVATEVSNEALEVARRNAKDLNLEVEFIESDLLDSVPKENFDILVANLPYIGRETNNFIAENVESHEPHVALFGGASGLELYEKLFVQVREGDWGFSFIMGEMGFSQGNGMMELANRELPGYSCEIRQDYQELDRYFILEKKV